MQLYEVAIACRAYTTFGGEFDDSFRQFVAKTGGALGLESDDCGSALMKWLNAWGCRQFAKDAHDDALERIRLWAQRYLPDLPAETKSILELTAPRARGRSTPGADPADDFYCVRLR